MNYRRDPLVIPALPDSEPVLDLRTQLFPAALNIDIVLAKHLIETKNVDVNFHHRYGQSISNDRPTGHLNQHFGLLQVQGTNNHEKYLTSLLSQDTKAVCHLFENIENSDRYNNVAKISKIFEVKSKVNTFHHIHS